MLFGQFFLKKHSKIYFKNQNFSKFNQKMNQSLSITTNQSNYDYNESIPNLTFDEFIDSIGGNRYIDLVYFYFFPVISVVGIVLNVTNILIFFRHKEFAQENFFYFRVTSVCYLIHSFLAMAYGLCTSPRFWPFGNSYIIIIVQISYIPAGNKNYFSKILFNS